MDDPALPLALVVAAAGAAAVAYSLFLWWRGDE